MSSTIEIGYGVARGKDSFKIGAQAARQALSGIETLPISTIIVFASIKYDLEEMLAGIASVTDKALVIGTTTAGEVCNRPEKGKVVVAALASPYLSVSAGVGENVSGDYRAAVAQAITASATERYFSPEEGMERRREALRQGRSAFALLFSPGNTHTTNSRSYEIVELLRQKSLGQLPIVGGSSADDWRMEANYVFHGKNVYPDSLLLALFESQLEFGIAVAHSYRPTDKKALVTKSSGRLVKELNHRPAAEAYAELLGYPLEELEGKHISLYTGKPCGARDAYGQYHLKVATHSTLEGWVRFTSPVFEGTMLTIMESTPEELIGAAREALHKALLRGNISSPAVVFVFSCALRDKILGEKTPLEIEAMREMLPDVPLVGFYSFGEQGLTDDGVSRANHETVAVLVLGRKLSMAAQTALENARLYESEQAERKIADTLRQASEVLNSTLNLEEVLKLILDQLGRVVSYDSASIQRLTADGLEIIACRGFDEPHKVMNIAFPLDPKFPNYQVVMTKKPYVIDDVRLEYPHFGKESESYQSGHIRSWLGVPLLVKDELIGMMALDRTTPDSYNDDQARLAMAFANQAAMAIENARLYEELRRKSDELEAEVTKRTQELWEAQEQLLRSERLAAIGQLASGVSHELRNPLGVIKNAAYFLRMELEEPADEVRQVLDILDKEVNVSNKIITDLLDFSRVRGPDLKPTDINVVIEENLERAEVMENVKVVTRLAESLPQIQADVDQMEQVFVNLITNALQAMPEGGELEIATRQEGPFLEVAIRDTGVGIPEEDLDKIFEPLFTTKAKGVGLGLAICKQLVEGHRGTIDAESEVGRGSVFTIRLPVD